jgi:hypothetical protein
MFKLPVRTWILNAAAVFSGPHGAVTRQAQRAGCSRQTVYQHAHKVEHRLAAGPAAAAVDEPRTEDRPPPTAAAPRPADRPGATGDDDRRQQMATTAVAMGLSLRQIEELLAILLPAAEVPDHATLGRWVQADAHRAGEVLAALDRACAPRVGTRALDEIFLGGDRPWLGASRRA